MLKVRLKLPYCIALVIVTVIATQCGAFYKERSEKIAAATELRLQKYDFESLYEELDERAKSLTPNAEFLARAEQLVGLMKGADPELRFAKSREGGVNPDFISDIYFVYRRLGKEMTQVDVEIWIDLNGGFPKLFDVCANFSIDPTVDTQRCLTNALRKV